MQKIGYALIIVLLCLLQETGAQNASLRGNVIEKSSQQSLPGVNVYFAGTTIGSASNSQGQFEIKKLKSGNYDLVVSFSGFKRIRKSVTIHDGDNVLDFEMEPSQNNLGEVVITGTGTPHHLKKAPVPTEIISKKTIETIGAPDFTTLMTTLSPSFDFSPGTMGAFMTLNGLSNDFILVLINGRRTYGDVGGNSDLNRINPDNIERIEIVKGASSLLYGSDAIAGVINIITKDSNRKINISNSSRLREYNTWQQNNTVDLNLGKFSSNTSFSRKQTDGWQLSKYEIDDDELVETDAQAQIEYEDYTISQHIGYNVTDKLSVYAEGSYYEKDMYRPQSVGNYGYYFEDETYHGGAKYLLGKRDLLSVDYHYDKYEYYYRYNQDYSDYEAGDLSINSDQRLTNVNAKYFNYFSSHNQLTLGLDYINEEYISDRVEGGEAEVGTYALYAQDEIKVFDKLDVVAGARLVKHDEFGLAFTPKVSVLYPIHKFNLRATYGFGFKAPTLKELYYYYEKSNKLYIGNTDLDPQTSEYTSLGFEYNTPKTSISVNAYRNNVDNLIDYVEVDLSDEDIANGITVKKQHFNIEETRSQGVDFMFNTFIGAGFNLGAGYSYVDAKDLTNDERLTGVAQNYGNVHLDYKHSWNNYHLGTSLTGRFQDEKYYDDSEGNAIAYQLVNFSTKHKFTSVKNFVFEVTAGIDNIFDFVDDSPYGSNYATLSPGRTYQVGLLINFSK